MCSQVTGFPSEEEGVDKFGAGDDARWIYIAADGDAWNRGWAYHTGAGDIEKITRRTSTIVPTTRPRCGPITFMAH